MKRSHLIQAVLGTLLLAGAGPALAAGTAAGTSVSNTATVDYSVGGVNQNDVNSNLVTFVVDRKINLTVAEVGGGYTQVVPGSNDQVLTFTVTNNGNATQDFRLIATQDPTGTTEAHGGTDDFDTTGVTVFVDVNGNGTYEAATDTQNFVDEIAADTVKTVFIVADIPGTATDNQTAGLTLTAVAAQSGSAGSLGADSTETAVADTAGSVDTVFADVAGDTDASRDGRHSDDDAYQVRTATITVNKSTTIVSDPFNGTTNPKRIPGAVVEYCIVVTNTGSTDADSVVITDSLAGQPVIFVTGSIFAGGDGSCAGGTAEDDDSIGADDTLSATENTGNFSASTVTTTVFTVPAGGTKSSRFRVTIQ